MVDRSVVVRLRADISDFQRKMTTAGTTTSAFVKNLDTADSRMGNLVQTALALGPALVPIAATGTPALVGLTSQAGFAAGAVGVLVAAFNGVGDSLKALREYELEPTEANLAKVREEMDQLPASAQQFVRYVDSDVLPVLGRLREASADGALPGFEDGIDDMLTRLPGLVRIVESLASASGQLAAEGGESLASDEWNAFFRFLREEAEPTLLTFGRTVGNVLDGLATTLVGLNPLANDFESALYNWSVGFSEIEPEDFESFVAYVRDVGPDAVDALGSLGSGLVAIVKAAAPVGAVTLPVIEALADVITVVAESPAGPVLIATAAGLSAVSRSIALFKAANGSALVATLQGVGKSAPVATSGLARMNSTITALKTGVPVLASLALAYSDIDDQIGLSNTAMLASMGLLAGPWGAAVGAGAGALLDLHAASEQATEGLRGLDDAIDSGNIAQLTERIREAKDELADQDKVTGFKDFFSDAARDLFTGGVGESVTDMYTQQIEDAEVALEELKNARADAAADKALYNSIQAETSVLRENIAAMRAKRAEALRGLNAELDYKASILDARDALKENGRTVNENTRAGQDNLRALYGLAAAWNSQDEATKNAAGSLRAARKNFVDMATAMGMGEQKAKDLARELFEIPTSRKVAIQVDADVAFQRIRAFQASIDSIDRNIVVGVSVVRGDTSGTAFLSGGVRGAGADGMTVPGQRHPYGDKVLIAAAPGEEVISNRYGQADRFRSDRAAGRIPGYADGGTVGRRKAQGGSYTPEETEAERRRREKREAEQEQRERDREKAEQNLIDLEERRRDREAKATEALIEGQEKAAQQLIDAAQTQLNAAEQVRDQWAQAMERVGAAATAGFRSNLFGPQRHGLWTGAGGGGSSWRSALMGDISGLQERSDLISLLSGQGVTGTALEALLGQADNSQIRGLLDAGEADDFAALFAQRESLLTAVGQQAGQAAYGQEYAAAMGQVAALGNQLLLLQQQLAAITAQRPITVYEAISAQATAAEVARLQSMAGAA